MIKYENYKPYKAKLRNGFSVGNFMDALGDKVDFIYAYHPVPTTKEQRAKEEHENFEEDAYYLLNDDMFGYISEDIVKEQIAEKRTVIINTHNLDLHAFNFDKSDIELALVKG